MKVFIMESLRPDNIYKEQMEGLALSKILNIIEFRNTYKVVISLEILKLAISEVTKNNYDIIHFSVHGNSDGICLTNGCFIYWEDLARYFQTFAQKGKLLILSSCESGVYGITKYLKLEKNKIKYIIGPKKEVHYIDSLLAWAHFYGLINNKNSNKDKIKRAVTRINKIFPGNYTLRYWDERVNNYKRVEKPKAHKIRK